MSLETSQTTLDLSASLEGMRRDSPVVPDYEPSSQNWVVTAGAAGVGLVAMYVGSYFLGKRESVVDPQSVIDYQEKQDENMVKLEALRRRLHDIQELVEKSKKTAEEGRDSILENAVLVREELAGLEEANRDAKDIEEGLDAAVMREEGIGTQMVALNRQGEEHTKAIGEMARDLHGRADSILHFLESRLAEGKASADSGKEEEDVVGEERL